MHVIYFKLFLLFSVLEKQNLPSFGFIYLFMSNSGTAVTLVSSLKKTKTSQDEMEARLQIFLPAWLFCFITVAKAPQQSSYVHTEMVCNLDFYFYFFLPDFDFKMWSENFMKRFSNKNVITFSLLSFLLAF